MALAALTASSGLLHAITLEELAAKAPLTVRTVIKGEAVDLGEGNQTNNLKEGGKVLLLSGQRLTSLAGISLLKVMDGSKPVLVNALEGLQVFLNDNALEDLPEEMAALDNITFIYVFQNRLQAIPPVVARMKGLQGMYFTGNRITEIPAFVYDMRQLRKLQVSKNHVKVIAPEIGQLRNLIHMNLSENEIESLPDTIASLTKLRVCDLSDNHLAQLPESFGEVRILYQLRVRNNPLRALPVGFAQMPGTIDITGTHIRMDELPASLRSKISTEKPVIKPKVIKVPDSAGR